ncbi:hypothetical protein E2562_036887 [Oryza meyeriana var. granulata]|uniref:RRM domain-containing protein n=1 Tax=Oryza meyeriana var. granulata TaxID=110450 RepID=A0A6G1ETE9_9ORYZ|nr:hypothetical protein E2562_036887 [Oryza meyeriana var. granulata]
MALPILSKMFVSGVATGIGEADLRRHFQQFGKMADVHMPIDRLTGRHRGFAFVHFTRLEHLICVLAYRHTIDGHAVGTR